MRSPDTLRLKRWSTLAATCCLLRSLYGLPAIAQEHAPECGSESFNGLPRNTLCRVGDSEYRIQVFDEQQDRLEAVISCDETPSSTASPLICQLDKDAINVSELTEQQRAYLEQNFPEWLNPAAGFLLRSAPAVCFTGGCTPD